MAIKFIIARLLLSEGCCWSAGGSLEKWDRWQWGHLLEYKSPVPSTALGPQDQTPTPKIELNPSANMGPKYLSNTFVCLYDMLNAISKYEKRIALYPYTPEVM